MLRRIVSQAAVALTVAAALWGAAPAVRGYEALLLLADLLGRPAPGWLDFRPPASRSAIEFERDGRPRDADLYRPDGRIRAAVVFVHGAIPRGKDDPRVVAFATMLARSRFAVLVPDVVALRELRLVPDSAVDVADALLWLQARPALVPHGRLGVVTTSVAIGPVMLALLDSPRAVDVRFVVSIGGYHSLPRMLTYFTTGVYDAHGISRRDPANDYGKWIVALSNASRLNNVAERAAFEALARRKLADPAADVSAELRQLGPAGTEVYDLVTNTDPARSLALLERLPEELRSDMNRLDLAGRDLQGVRARFILVHGEDDGMIPYGESVALAEALPAGRARLFVIAGFQHVETTSRLVDAYRLWRAFCALIAEGERS